MLNVNSVNGRVKQSFASRENMIVLVKKINFMSQEARRRAGARMGHVKKRKSWGNYPDQLDFSILISYSV